MATPIIPAQDGGGMAETDLLSLRIDLLAHRGRKVRFVMDTGFPTSAMTIEDVGRGTLRGSRPGKPDIYVVLRHIATFWEES